MKVQKVVRVRSGNGGNCGLTKARQHTVNSGRWVVGLPDIILCSWYAFDVSYL